MLFAGPRQGLAVWLRTGGRYRLGADVRGALAGWVLPAGWLNLADRGSGEAAMIALLCVCLSVWGKASGPVCEMGAWPASFGVG